MMLTLTLLAALAPVPPAQSIQDAPEQVQVDIIDRRAAELPRAVKGTWKSWKPGEEPSIHVIAALTHGNEAYGANNLRGALDGYWGVLELSPGYPPVLHQMGVVYFRLHRYTDAIECFERFLLQVPDYLTATRALGHALYSVGRYDDARIHYENILLRDPAQQETRRGLALTLSKQGRTDLSLMAFESYLEAVPKSSEARTQYAEVLYDVERVEDALAQARQAAGDDPFASRPWFVISRVLYEMGADEEADAAHAKFTALNEIRAKVRSIENQLLIQPRRFDLMLALIELHRDSGNAAGVRDIVSRLTTIDPGQLRWPKYGHIVLQDIGDASGALDAARFIEENYPTSREALDHLLEFYTGIEDEDSVKRIRALLDGTKPGG
jgi:tetratricopeptide (TPR) repeat protein